MNWTYLTVCETSHAAIKARWRDFLAKEPAWRSAKSPEKLSAAMDSVLGGLWAVLHSSNVSNYVRGSAPTELPAWSMGACRLDATLAFLSAGKRAVQMIAQKVESTQSDLPRAERSEQWAELMLAFDVVSQRQIQRICGSCYSKSRCALGDGPQTAVPGEGSHAPAPLPWLETGARA